MPQGHNHHLNKKQIRERYAIRREQQGKNGGSAPAVDLKERPIEPDQGAVIIAPFTKWLPQHLEADAEADLRGDLTVAILERSVKSEPQARQFIHIWLRERSKRFFGERSLDVPLTQDDGEKRTLHDVLPDGKQEQPLPIADANKGSKLLPCPVCQRKQWWSRTELRKTKYRYCSKECADEALRMRERPKHDVSDEWLQLSGVTSAEFLLLEVLRDDPRVVLEDFNRTCKRIGLTRSYALRILKKRGFYPPVPLKVVHACPTCKKGFLKATKYCSRDCMLESWGNAIRASTETYRFLCAGCGVFREREVKAGKKGRPFCSLACFRSMLAKLSEQQEVKEAANGNGLFKG